MSSPASASVSCIHAMAMVPEVPAAARLAEPVTWAQTTDACVLVICIGRKASLASVSSLSMTSDLPLQLQNGQVAFCRKAALHQGGAYASLQAAYVSKSSKI